jgi:hypothetical protein
MRVANNQSNSSYQPGNNSSSPHHSNGSRIPDFGIFKSYEQTKVFRNINELKSQPPNFEFQLFSLDSKDIQHLQDLDFSFDHSKHRRDTTTIKQRPNQNSSFELLPSIQNDRSASNERSMVKIKDMSVEMKPIKYNRVPRIKVSKKKDENARIEKIIEVLNSTEKPENVYGSINTSNALEIIQSGGGLIKIQE